jgi:CubicO group peptidase (beta-lactamase class C family)
MAPLGITSTQIWEDATGTYLGGVGFDSSPRDFARFGLLHLRGGVWDGERILSEEWIDHTREPSASNATYGAHWWLLGRRGSFSAQGLFGQQVIVDPELDLVVVTTATAGGDSPSVSSAIVDEFARVLVG